MSPAEQAAITKEWTAMAGDLTLMVVRLVRRVRLHDLDDKVAAHAMDYLSRKGLIKPTDALRNSSPHPQRWRTGMSREITAAERSARMGLMGAVGRSAWDRWYGALPEDLKRKLAIHDFKRLGDCLSQAIAAHQQERSLVTDGELAEAVWQILDDFGRDGLSVCGAAKARLRIAYEPYRESDSPLEFTLEAARAIESSL